MLRRMEQEADEVNFIPGDYVRQERMIERIPCVDLVSDN